MDSSEPEPTHPDRPDPTSTGIAPHPVPIVPKRSPDQQGRILILGIAAGLMAGVASSLVGEVILGRYQSDLVPTVKAHPTAEDLQHWRDARLYSATLTFMTMGSFLGLTMGLAGGLARRSVLASASAAMAGLVLGTATGASLALVLVSNFYKIHDPQSNDLVLPLLTHGAIWSTLGAIGGLAFGLGLGGKHRWILHGCGGARRGGRGDDYLRTCRCPRLRDQQDRPTRVILDHDTSDGPIAGRHPGSGRCGPGLAPIPEARARLALALLRSTRATEPRQAAPGRSPTRLSASSRRPQTRTQ